MLRKQNRHVLRDSPSNSAQPSYQSTCPSSPHVYDCATKVSSPNNPMRAFLSRTYCRTVDSATSTSGISRRRRVQIRCEVCRCFLGALRSDSKIPQINGTAGPSSGRSRSGTFRSAGIALASAFRTSRRCTPNFRATARIVPAPCSYSRRICSYSSTLALLFSKTVLSFRAFMPETRYTVSDLQVGPNQSIERGQFRVAKSDGAVYRYFQVSRQTYQELLGAESQG